MRMPVDGYFFDGAWISDWGRGTEDDRIALENIVAMLDTAYEESFYDESK